MTISVDQKVAGVLIPIFALRSDEDLGIGDTKCFLQAIDFCADNDLSILQTLPINETSGDNSPYNALSSMALEPCLLSMTLDMVPGLTEKILSDNVAREASADANEVDYQFVKALKLRILRSAFESFMA
ncbi:MAG: 4-alpha-glucanotransferase, partial [Cyanobacteria bacterium]|nr:4-alpha-glucanotransferase [Cyanobacteriota bacterium]